LGIEERPFDRIVSYIGTGVRDLMRKSLGSSNSAISDEAVEIFSRYYVKHSADRSKLYPHVKEVLNYFKDKRKFVVTNRFRKFADMTLKELGIRRYFEDIVGGDDESCMKPSRCVLDRMFSRLGIDRKRAMIVGDMVIDIKTGKNSGMATSWVTYGLGKRKDLRNLKPDYIIDDIMELKEIIR
ncbi:MAG: HAD-IA family hydrolase, partial [Candidatus Omnitrophica bacterium]|nr:HAD-IA family hydrolase [Candidatus Omnitrophota bacterium]